MWFRRQSSGVELDRWLLLDALRALRRGDFAIQLPPGLAATDGEIATTFNEVVQIARTLQDELREVRSAVGRDGRSARRVRDAGMRGGWAACMWSINDLLDDVLASAPPEPTTPRADRATSSYGEPPSHDRFAQRALEQKAFELEQRNAELERKLHDLSSRHERLAQDAQRHEQVAERRSQFLAAMSHELRTPLNTLLTLSHKLTSEGRSGRLEPQLAKYIEAIGQAGSEVLSLANDVLDASKLESSGVRVESSAVPLAEIAAYAEQCFQPVALERRLSFRVSVDPELPAAIETDANRLKQVLRNLLGNAFKFTEHGGVRLSILRKERRQGITFAVSDTGIGIRRQDQELIFEPFTQVAAPVDRNEPGTGLGLTISREIVQALGGSLQVSSMPGRGSTFTVELPLVEARAPRRSAIVERVEPQRPLLASFDEGAPLLVSPRRDDGPAAEPALANRSVRIVNGDVRNVFAVTAALEPHAVRVSYGESGDAEPSAAEHVDAVLVDIDGPALAGRENLLRIRSRNPRPTLLVAMVSRAEHGAREHCVAAGADDCIGKPLDPDELIATLRAWFEHTALPAATSERSEPRGK